MGRKRAYDRAYQARAWREGRTWKQRNPEAQREADTRYNHSVKRLVATIERRSRQFEREFGVTL
jgi:hypothetical protein